jgi:hypothetical protein
MSTQQIAKIEGLPEKRINPFVIITAATAALASIEATGKSIERKDRSMRMLTIVLAAVIGGLAPTALADSYKDLAAQGYRWVSVDGPYACRSKDDLRKLSKHRTDEMGLRMVQEGGAYYLIQGQIVQVDLEDSAAEMSQIHVPGHATKVWTLTQFLSRKPIRDASGIFETPTTLNMMPSEQMGVLKSLPDTTATPSPTAKATKPTD